MPQHVCLIQLPAFVARESLSYYAAVPPLGLAYLAASTRQAGHQVTVIDGPGEAIRTYWPYEAAQIINVRGQGLTLPQILERIPESADVIGISCSFIHQWLFTTELITAIRERFPGKLIVLGGETPSGMWPQAMAMCPEADVLVHGEGEQKFLDLLDARERDRPFHEVPGLILRRRGEAYRTSGPTRMKNIDDLPWPAWDLFRIENYLDAECQSGVNRGRSMPILSSRGCPYECTFCSSPQMWTTRYVFRDPEKVLDEIEHNLATYNATNIDFYDLTSFFTKRWIRKWHDDVKRRNLDFTFQVPVGTRSEILDREMLQMMYDTGFRNFSYAVESSSPEIIASMKKKVRLNRLIPSAEAALDIGINVHATIIIGYPEEKRANHWEYFRLAMRFAKLGFHSMSFIQFCPYPGSELFQSYVDRDAIDFDDPRYLFGPLMFGGADRSIGPRRMSFHPTFSGKYLFWLQFVLLRSFYAAQFFWRPSRLWRIFRNVMNGYEETTVEQFFLMKLRKLRLKVFQEDRPVAERSRATAVMASLFQRVL